MANAATYPFFCVLLTLCLGGSYAGEYCTTRGSYFLGDFTWCPYGCCGYYPREYCCSANVGLIVGIIIACITVICTIIALICCCIKRPGQQGRMVVPSQGNTVTLVYSGTSGQYPGPQYGYGGYSNQPVQPPPYKQMEDTPAPPAYSNPVYPPSMAPPPPGFALPSGPAAQGSSSGMGPSKTAFSS